MYESSPSPLYKDKGVVKVALPFILGFVILLFR